MINNTVQLPRMESQENLSKICLYTGWCFSSTTRVISSYLQGNQLPCAGYSTVDYALTLSLLHLLFLGFQLVLFTFCEDISRWACAVCVCVYFCLLSLLMNVKLFSLMSKCFISRRWWTLLLMKRHAERKIQMYLESIESVASCLLRSQSQYASSSLSVCGVCVLVLINVPRPLVNVLTPPLCSPLLYCGLINGKLVA